MQAQESGWKRRTLSQTLAILTDVDANLGKSSIELIARYGVPVSHIVADLSEQSEVRRVGREILELAPRIDVLVNSVGAIFTSREVTRDGLERTFALNYLGHFLLTHVLLSRIVSNSPARIINVSSSAHFRGRLGFDDLQYERQFSGFDAYDRSELAVILFTRALARRLHSTKVTANCLDPGMARTHIHDSITGHLRVEIERMKALIGVTAAEAAETVIYLASAPEVAGVSGEYFVECKIAQPSAAACDDDSAKRLWAVSTRLACTEREQQVLMGGVGAGW